MGFGQAIKSGFQNYANFSGRASRSEFWWFILFNAICQFVANILDSLLGFRIISGETASGTSFTYAYNTGWLSAIVFLAFLLPVLGLWWRRLHDTDRSGLWSLLWFICCIGWIILIVWWASPGTPGPNKFGAPPTA